MDKTIFYFFNHFAGQYLYLNALLIFVAEYLIFILALTHLLFFLRSKKIRPWLLSLAALALGSLIRKLIKTAIFRPRPFVVLENVNNLLTHVTAREASFPSGHTLAAFIMAWTLYWVNRKIGYAALAVATLIGLARIAVGVHYPSDVLVGFVLATTISFLTKKIYEKIR